MMKIYLFVICIVGFIIAMALRRVFLYKNTRRIYVNTCNNFMFLTETSIRDVSYFTYNPSIYWINRDNGSIGVISRISGHVLVPRLNKCQSIPKKLCFVDGAKEYFNIFGKRGAGCSGIVYHSANIFSNSNSGHRIINPFFSSSNVCSGKYLGFEDPRVFMFRGKEWIIVYFRGINFPFPSDIDTSKMSHQIVIFPLDMSFEPKLLDYRDRKNLEKNWMPFEYNNEMYIVYSIYPHKILHVDTDTGKCTLAYISKFTGKIHDNVGNGAPPKIFFLRDKHYFLGLAHVRGSVKSGIIRKNFFYVFENIPPFSIKYVSPVFNIRSEYANIEFGSGLLLNQEKGVIYISYGVEDCYSSIATLDFWYVMELLGLYSKRVSKSRGTTILGYKDKYIKGFNDKKRYNMEKKAYTLLKNTDIIPGVKFNDKALEITLNNCGETLNRRNIPIDFDTQCAFINDTLRRHNIYHNDLHGENIIVDKNGKMRIIDFEHMTMHDAKKDGRFRNNDVCNIKYLFQQDYTKHYHTYSEYAAKNAQKSKKTGGGGMYQSVQRNPQLRIDLLRNVNFNGKTVLDIGSNSGKMLTILSDKIKWGVGVDFDPVRVNESNLETKKYSNLRFFTFDINKEPLDVLLSLVPELPDIVLLFAVCQMWIYPCNKLLSFIKKISKVLCVEINGSPKRQDKMIKKLRDLYDNVVEVTDNKYCPDCSNRKLFYAY